MNAIRDITSGVLGYIADGRRGAKRAIAASNSFQKKMKRKAEGDGSLILTKKGRLMAKLRRNGKASKKQSKYKVTIKNLSKKTKKGSKLKTMVKREALKVIHAERPKGVYQKNVIYNFPTVAGSTTTPLQNVINQLLFGNSGGYTDANMATGTYNKLIDAASVLFNGKAAAFYTATGDLSPGGTIIPDFSHLAVYKFTNNTPVQQCFLIYETTPKEDRTGSNDVYTTWAACTNTQVGGTTRGITFFGNRPEYYSQFRDQYKILKKKSICIKPGETFTYKIKSSTQHLKLDDWLPVGSLTPVMFRKNFTKELLVINWNETTYGYPNSTSYMAGSWNVSNSVGYGIGVESREWFKMRCPENVDSTKNDDNVFCIWSQYFDDVSASTGTTVATPAYSAVIAVQ